MPNTKLEDNPLSAVPDCLFNIGLFTTTLHTGNRFSNRNLRTRHAMVTVSCLWRNLIEIVERNNFFCLVPTSPITAIPDVVFPRRCSERPNKSGYFFQNAMSASSNIPWFSLFTIDRLSTYAQGYGLDCQGIKFRFLAVKNNLIFAATSRSVVGPTQLPIQWATSCIFPG